MAVVICSIATIYNAFALPAEIASPVELVGNVIDRTRKLV
jgi:hypothetical protein